MTASEAETLERVFGNLWPLMVAEAVRGEDEKINPLLKTLLESEEVRLAKRDIASQIGNDVFKNSLRRVYRGGDVSTPYISLDDDRKLLSPSERLLNMVAAIVHKSNVAEKIQQKKLRHTKKTRKQARKNPLGIVTMQKPKRRFVDRILSVNRMKRSLIKFGTDLADMKALLDHANHENDDDDDYMNDEDDSDYDYQTLSSPDDDFHQNRQFYEDYENGSVNEFINRARQRDRREKSDIEWKQQQQQQDFNDVNEYEGEDDDYETYDEN